MVESVRTGSETECSPNVACNLEGLRGPLVCDRLHGVERELTLLEASWERQRDGGDSIPLYWRVIDSE